jgi:hypothetical protein
MVAAIRRVVNNTPWVVHFYNTEDHLTLTVDPKHESERNHHVPSKSCDSWIPFASTGNYIELTLGDSAPVRLSDDNYQFKIVEFPDGDGRQGHPSWEKPSKQAASMCCTSKRTGSGGVATFSRPSW